ncbi:2867_t:CDS:2, partial [Acaulospora morrowiae]
SYAEIEALTIARFIVRITSVFCVRADCTRRFSEAWVCRPNNISSNYKAIPKTKDEFKPLRCCLYSFVRLPVAFEVEAKTSNFSARAQLPPKLPSIYKNKKLCHLT